MIFGEMDMKYLVVLLHVAIVSSDLLDRADNKAKTTISENSIFPDSHETSLTNDDKLKDGSCREVSLHKCGSSMVQVFRLLDFLPLGKSLDAKCSLRKAFFTCLKTDAEPCKKRRWSVYHSTAFRRKLLQSLWSTRRCVLGYRPDYNDIAASFHN